MKKNPFAGKNARTKIFAVITVLSVILVLALNIFLTKFTIYGNGYIDLTPEGLYTLRDEMVDASKEILADENGVPVDPGIKVTFCDDPDNLIDNTYTRVVYYMCIAMSRKFDNFTVETVNINIDPTSVAEYKTTSLTVIESTDVIVSCGQRYRITNAKSFWRIGSEKVYSYDGEYKLASLMMSLTMVNRPAAYFVTNHGETYYDAENLESEGTVNTEAFAGLLLEKGFQLKTLDLGKLISDAEEKGEAPAIPDDCVLLIINNPTEDFAEDAEGLNSLSYISETELLDRYMADERGSIMVAKDYRISLPNFEDFLADWGIECGSELVIDEKNFIETTPGEISSTLITEYDKDETSYGYAIYQEYADLESAPITVVSDTGYVKSAFGASDRNNEAGTYSVLRVYMPFLYTSTSAVYYADDNGDGNYDALASDRNKEESLAVAAVSGRQNTDGDTGNQHYSYIFCAASASFFSNEIIGNASYANYDIMSALVHNIARLESYADTSLGGMNANNDDDSFLGKMLVDTQLYEKDQTAYKFDERTETQVLVTTIYAFKTWAKVVYTVIIAAVPLAIAVIGIVACVKRKYL